MSVLHLVTIRNDDGPVSTFELDGELLQADSAVLYIDGGNLPTMEVRLPVNLDVKLFSQVKISRDVAETLIALGWTPPPGEME